jgi:glutamate:GABA antiporter
MINWIISPAEGLIQSANDNYLPRYFTHRNKHGVASRVLIAQAIIVSLTSLVLLMHDINTSYWLLTALSTELYVSMYALMFCAALFLYFKTRKVSPILRFVGGKWTLFILCTLGLCGCGITLIVGSIAPVNFYHGSRHNYHLMFIAGLLLMLAPVLLGYCYKIYNEKN